MKIIDAYLEPIISAALARRDEQRKLGSSPEKIGEIADEETLVDHLLKVTEGMHGYLPTLPLTFYIPTR